MDDEARATGLGPAPDREPRGPRRGRRSPYRHPRERWRRSGLDVPGPTYAALDLGTNNCRLLVARATRDSFRVVDAFSRIIRLGEGITSSGRLSEAAILRAVDALRVCRAKMRNRGVTRARLIATEACRAAGNGLDFLERVQSEVGIELEIVDRETEARLAATGCTPLVDPSADGVILFDIGGGSSELVRLDRSQAHPSRPAASRDQRLGLDPDRRRHACGAPRRRHRQPRSVRDDDRRGRRTRRSLRRRARRHRGPAPARHLGHGDDHRRRLSRAAALRAPPRRWLLDDRHARSTAWSSGCSP